jgi:hypothetical protein
MKNPSKYTTPATSFEQWTMVKRRLQSKYSSGKLSQTTEDEVPAYSVVTPHAANRPVSSG